MQTSMASTEQSETCGLTNPQQDKPQVTLKWTIQRLNRTWFLFEKQALRIEKKADDGATDEQWQQFMASNGIRIKNGQSKPLGPIARRDLLNMLENVYPDRMPVFFDSKEFALSALAESNENALNDEEQLC